ncbi:MAG: ATP-grasp domain-containing protein [Xanthobacteraceae bacterium]
MTRQSANIHVKSDPHGDAAGALILGGAHGSLAVARSLGRHGIPVCFLTDDHPLPRFSRYVEQSFTWAGPGHETALDTLLDLCRRHRLEKWVLVAGGDAEVRFVAQHHSALSAVFRLTTPPWETVQWAHDKRLTYQRAQSLGIAVPRSYAVANLQSLTQLDVRFPVILKPAVRHASNAFTNAKAWRVDDRARLLEGYALAAALVGEQAILVQELIPGTGATQFSYAAVWHQGSPVGSVVARRTRQFPIDFGFTSTYVETVEAPEVEAAACRFLRSLNFSGLAEIEFKFDVRDQSFKILDVNARTWAWIALGATAGVDFPYLLWQLADGRSISPVRGRTGVAWMHVSRDVVAASQEMLAGTLSETQYLRSWSKPLVYATFAADDPLPGLIELPLVLYRVGMRWLRVRMRADERPHHAPVA